MLEQFDKAVENYKSKFKVEKDSYTCLTKDSKEILNCMLAVLNEFILYLARDKGFGIILVVPNPDFDKSKLQVGQVLTNDEMFKPYVFKYTENGKQKVALPVYTKPELIPPQLKIMSRTNVLLQYSFFDIYELLCNEKIDEIAINLDLSFPQPIQMPAEMFLDGYSWAIKQGYIKEKVQNEKKR